MWAAPAHLRTECSTHRSGSHRPPTPEQRATRRVRRQLVSSSPSPAPRGHLWRGGRLAGERIKEIFSGRGHGRALALRAWLIGCSRHAASELRLSRAQQRGRRPSGAAGAAVPNSEPRSSCSVGPPSIRSCDRSRAHIKTRRNCCARAPLSPHPRAADARALARPGRPAWARQASCQSRRGWLSGSSSS
jgi:hypothetical protein